MDKENTFGAMETFMKENFKMMISMVIPSSVSVWLSGDWIMPNWVMGATRKIGKQQIGKQEITKTSPTIAQKRKSAHDVRSGLL